MSFPSIILFGDSLTEQSFSPEKQGFGASLSNTYARRADVLNRGLLGLPAKVYLDSESSSHRAFGLQLGVAFAMAPTDPRCSGIRGTALGDMGGSK